MSSTEVVDASGAKRAWPWAFAFLSLGFSASVQIGDVRAALDPIWFAPFLAAWLGARLGRAAWRPFLIAAPFLALVVQFNIDALSVWFGYGPTVLALCALALAAFSAPPVLGVPSEARDQGALGARLAGFAVLTIALVLAAGELGARYGLEFDYDAIEVKLAVGGGVVAIALGFWVVASGRVGLAWAAGAAILAGAALWGAFALAERLEWTMEAYAELDLGSGWLDLAAGLESNAAAFAAWILAGAGVGALVAPMWRSGGRALPQPSAGLAAATWAAIFILPAVTLLPEVLGRYDIAPFNRLAAEEVGATKGGAVLASADGLVAYDGAFEVAQATTDEVVVTGTRVNSPLPFGLGGVFIALIAAWSFALGARWPRQAVHGAPAAVIVGAVAAAWLQQGPQISEGRLVEKLVDYAGAAAIAFVFAALAAEVARRRAASQEAGR